MSDYVIMTDTNSDIDESYAQKEGIGLLDMPLTIGGVDYNRKTGQQISNEDLFKRLRSGDMPTTCQSGIEEIRELLEDSLKKGLDVLFLSFSSRLSGNYDSVCMIKKEIEGEYPGRRIEIIDTKCVTYALAILVSMAVDLKNEGKTLSEVASFVNDSIQHMNHLVTLSDLFHLQKGGRLSKTSAIVGTVMGIKPLLRIDKEGALVAYSKVRGRKESLIALVSEFEQKFDGNKTKYVIVAHGDMIDDAKFVRDLVNEKHPGVKTELKWIGPSVGTHIGPSVITLFFYGKERDK